MSDHIPATPNAPMPPVAYAMIPTGDNAHVDMRMADCGQLDMPGWQVAWAQVVGCHHAVTIEDSVVARGAAYSQNVGGGYSPHALAVAVADGGGGGSRGDVASSALVEHCAALAVDSFDDAEAIAAWVYAAEEVVQTAIRAVSHNPGAATLAAAWLRPCDAPSDLALATGYVVRVGDARAYRFDGTTLHQLTIDQTYASLAEPVPCGGLPNDPARMIGTNFVGVPEIIPFTLGARDTLLLCSDGLHGILNATDIGSQLICPSQAFSFDAEELAHAANTMAQSARIAGGDDDITVLLLRANKFTGGSQAAEKSLCLDAIRSTA